MKRFALLILPTLLIATACAQRTVVAETPVPAPLATPAPKPKPQIKYVYIRQPEATVSAMTMPPLEPSQAQPRNLASDVVKIFWPLLTLLATGAVMIVGLFIEYKVIDRQLAKRRELKTQSA